MRWPGWRGLIWIRFPCWWFPGRCGMIHRPAVQGLRFALWGIRSLISRSLWPIWRSIVRWWLIPCGSGSAWRRRFIWRASGGRGRCGWISPWTCRLRWSKPMSWQALTGRTMRPGEPAGRRLRGRRLRRMRPGRGSGASFFPGGWRRRRRGRS